MNVIETQALTKFYGTSRGIIDVSLSVKEEMSSRISGRMAHSVMMIITT